MSLSSIFKSSGKGEGRVITLKKPIVQIETDENLSPEERALQILSEAKIESDRLRQQLEKERDLILSDLQREREQWVIEKEEEKNRAQKDGYNDGFSKGLEEAQKSFEERLDLARHIVTSAEEDYRKYIEQSEGVILNLSIAIAGRIISEVLEKEPSSWTHLIQQAIKEVRDQEMIKIMVAPDRFTQVLKDKEALQAVAHNAVLQIFPDESLGENACYIETPYGRIDASVDQQLRVIKQKLKALLEAEVDGSKGAN